MHSTPMRFVPVEPPTRRNRRSDSTCAAAIEAFEADAKVRHAQLLVGLGRYSEALPLLRRAQTVKPPENIQEYMEQVERVANSR